MVTLSELSPAAVDGVTWGAPVFSGEGVTPVDGGAQVTVGEEGLVEVALDNPATPVVPPATVPPVTEPPGETPPAAAVPPTEPPAARPTATGGALATTGATAGVLAGVAALLLGTGLTLVALRRRGAVS
ncbi:hypothetical protein ACFWGN_16810 [Oerskovia sp. NPDC060338]|uniref:hypothetical protein n=1 Tax=Oerskovia sp. NPDC060338 TaxID=3347100 RepID=UPI003663CC05